MASGPNQTSGTSGVPSTYQTALQKLSELEKGAKLAKKELKEIDADHNGKVSKDELVASQAAGLADPQEKQKVAETWGQIYDAAAGKDGKLSTGELSKLITAFTGSGVESAMQYHTRAEVKERNPLAYNQDALLHDVTQKIDDLNAEKGRLAKDLANPARRSEAKARMALLDQQISELNQVRRAAERFEAPANQTPEEAKTRAEVFEKMNGLVKDLSNLVKRDEAQAELTVLKGLLKNPSAYDPNAAMLTNDPFLKNQAIATQNVTQRIGSLVKEQDALIKDLSDPRKHDEAKARLALLRQQIGDLQHLRQEITSFQPASQTPEEAKTRAELVNKMDNLVKDLADPRKAAEAHSRMTLLSGLMRNPALYDPKAAMLTNDKTLRNQAIAVQNASQRIADLQGQAGDLIKDLSDPRKAPEAHARLQLLNQQIADTMQVRRSLESYHRPSDLSPENAEKSAELIKRMDDLTRDLSNPTKSAEAHARLTLLNGLLRNPNLFDPQSPTLTDDPVLKNQATAVQNASQRIASLVGEMNGLIKDLGNPRKAAEAQARLQLLNQQVADVASVRRELESYRRPADLTPEQATQAADTLKQMDGLVRDLSNPTKQAEAHARLAELGSELRNPGLADDPVLKNQATAVQNANQRIRQLTGEMNDLIKDLGNPRKAPEAQARLQLLDRQLDDVRHFSHQLEAYRRPADLTPEQVKASADLLKEANDLLKDLSDPRKHDAAQAKLVTLMDHLRHPRAIA